MSYNKYITQYTNHIFDVNYIALSLLQIACILFPLVIIYGQPIFLILTLPITSSFIILFFVLQVCYYTIKYCTLGDHNANR